MNTTFILIAVALILGMVIFGVLAFVTMKE